MSKIISLHVPKTAGTSFHLIMQKQYKSSKILDMKPIVKRCENVLIEKKDFSMYGEEFLHGHFTLLNFEYDLRWKYLIWLRNPVERVISHYFYFKVKPIAAYVHPLEYKIKYEKMSLVDFIQVPCMQNLQSFYMNGSDNIDKFDFIGITEYFDKSIDILSEKLNLDLQTSYKKERINVHKKDIDNNIKKLIQKINEEDCDLYSQVFSSIKN